MRALELVLVAVTAAACASPAPDEDAGLVATLVSPTDVALTWDGDEPGAAGRIVEFATEPQGRYTILEFLPPSQTVYEHPDLMPETPFYYRLRPFYGPASDPVEVGLPDGALDEGAEHGWATPRTVRRGPAPQRSIRNADPAAAPTQLKVSVVHANGVKLDWTDRASDEDGYLVEVRGGGAPEFSTAAVLDPDINSFGLITLPAEKKASFRVRAVYYGAPSNVAHQTTGAG
jgi:predicted component of type VI protein secretion system